MTTIHKSSRMAPAILAGMLAAGTIPATAQVQVIPPDQMNYQGVLRDQNGNPLTGTYDMVFRFMDAATAGNEILVDSHTAANSNAVIVAGGLFDTALGTGTISDGSGPGTYTLMRLVFKDYSLVWLEIQVGTETLSPRTRIQSAPYAFNAAYLRGRLPSEFLDTSTTDQGKAGSLLVGTSGANPALEGVSGFANAPAIRGYNYAGGTGGEFVGTGGYGVTASGTTGTIAGRFSIPAGPWVELAKSTKGVEVGGFATDYAGYFTSNRAESTGIYADGGVYGIEAHGTTAGGFFRGNSVANVKLAFGNVAVEANGSSTGGIFKGLAPGGEARLADDGVGISATGAVNRAAGIFTGGGASARLADAAVGISARGSASNAGGIFTNGTAGVEARLADGAVGIRASGNNIGGEFTNGSSTGQVPYADRGINAVGSWIGGSFKNNAYPATQALVAVGEAGIQAGGPSYGGYLYNGSPWFSYAYIPNTDRGITAWGSAAGGEFANFSSGAYAYVGSSSYKIIGNGAVSFVQNHPQDPSKVIVYAAPEGDEVAVYTRGSGRLVDGEARVALGGTFALVTNPDIGLTATATPRGDEPVPLVVSKLSPGEIVVRGPAGSDADFDYMVWGLRIGFEEQSIVQPKKEEAMIPSMHMHAQYFQDEPALREHTALARFQGIEASVRGKQSFDFSKSQELTAAIGVAPKAEPAPPADAPQSGRRVPALAEDPSGRPESPVNQDSGSIVGESRPSPAAEPRATVAPLDETSLFLAGEPIEPGDLVSLSKDTAGYIVRSAGPDDALLIGCAQPVETNPGTVAVASSRIALCRVDASHGPISIGDRLVASASPGMAMKMDASTAGAQVLGRAIEPLEAGTALVRVLLVVK